MLHYSDKCGNPAFFPTKQPLSIVEHKIISSAVQQVEIVGLFAAQYLTLLKKNITLQGSLYLAGTPAETN